MAARTCGAGRRRRPNGPGAGSPHWRTMPRSPRQASVPVTFCSRIAGIERLEDRPGPTEADPAVAPVQLHDQRMVARLEARSVIVEAEPAREGVERRLGARAPGFAADPVTGPGQLDRRRPERRARRPDHRSPPRAAWSDRRFRGDGRPASGAGRAVRRPRDRGGASGGEFWQVTTGRRAGAVVRDARSQRGRKPFRHWTRQRSTRDHWYRSTRRATPQSRRGHGAHRHSRRGRRPRIRRIPGPQPCQFDRCNSLPPG